MTATSEDSSVMRRMPDRRLSGTASRLLAALAAASQVLGAPPRVAVSIGPQVAAVRSVGGPAVTVEVLVQTGQAAESFDPTPRQLAMLQETDLYITVGMPFERPLCEKLAAVAPRLKVVDGTSGLKLQPMEEAGASGDDAHGGMDPHFWLDPAYMAAHAGLVALALTELDPPGAPGYASRLRAFRQELDGLAGRIGAVLEPCRGKSVVVVHPAFGYLTRRFGLTQLALQHEGKEPAARQLAELEARVRTEGVAAVFVQVQFPSRAAEVLADELGVPVVALDDLSSEYAANLEDMAKRLAGACGRGAGRVDARHRR